MSANDPLEKLINDFDAIEVKEPPHKRLEKISKSASNKQSTGDIVDFGFVKIWTVLLEIFSIFYVQTQERKNNVTYKNLKNDKNETTQQESK